jgi:hypothetical protein
MTTLTIAQRVAAIQAARVAGSQPTNTKLDVGVAIGNIAAKVESNTVRAVSSFLDTRIALAQERKEQGYRW